MGPCPRRLACVPFIPVGCQRAARPGSHTSCPAPTGSPTVRLPLVSPEAKLSQTRAPGLGASADHSVSAQAAWVCRG